jgi:hypothetical protein
MSSALTYDLQTFWKHMNNLVWEYISTSDAFLDCVEKNYLCMLHFANFKLGINKM